MLCMLCVCLCCVCCLYVYVVYVVCMFMCMLCMFMCMLCMFMCMLCMCMCICVLHLRFSCIKTSTIVNVLERKVLDQFCADVKLPYNVVRTKLNTERKKNEKIILQRITVLNIV